MSTQSFMSHIRKSPGRFAFALLLGTLLALPCLAPAVVFARASGQAEARSLLSARISPTDAVLNKAGVSVVRLVATYGVNSTQVTCTSLGVLVASEAPSATSKNYVNWVLTDGNLISTAMSKCGVVGNKWPLLNIDILASSEYANQQLLHLDTLSSCSVILKPTQIWICNSLLQTGNKNTIINPAPGKFSYTLLSFQSAGGQPYLGLASTTSTFLNVGLGKASNTVYPFKQSDGQENPANYLLPSIVRFSGNASGSSGSAPASTNPIEGGTPEVDMQGNMVGIWMTDGKGGYLPVPAEMLRPILSERVPLSTLPQTPVQSCSVVSCWDQGIDVFNTATKATQYAQAHTYLDKAYHLNQLFAAAHTFDVQAVKNEQNGSDQDGPSGDKQQPLVGLLDQYPWAIYAVGGVLIVLLLLVVVLALRARKKRRELKKFGEEVEESRRIAAAMVAQQQHGSPPPPPPPAPQVQSSCPNCHAPVYVTDAMCPKCRFPLAPTASGMGVRLMGNAPRGSAPLPPLAAQPLSPYIDQPTMQMLPGSPLPAMAEASEPTQYVQQMRGHNLSLAVGTRTNPGIKRKHKPNEDSVFAARWGEAQFGLFVVADGMGGHANGQDASRLAIQTIIDFMLPLVTEGEHRDDQAFLKLMENGVQASNQAVHARNMESHADMGTTMTAALVVGSTAYVANVGDSRTYLYREGEGLSKVTHDHSVVASLVDAGIIKPDDIYTHPKRNQIYRSLGEKPVVEVDTFPVKLRASDKLLLCSDGLWDMVRDPLIQNVLGKTARDLNETGQNLIDAALNGGGEDNVSVIVIQLSETNEFAGISGVQLLYKPETVTFPNLTPH